MSDPTAAAPFPMALEEFCARRSSDDKRIELIGGFFHVEKRAGHLRDTEANFNARFQAFANAPA